MNFADLENTWRSPHNQPSAGELEKQKMDLIRTLHRRDRGFAIGLTLIFAALIVMTVALLRNQWFDGTSDRIDFQNEWSAVLFFLVPWFAALWILMRYRGHLARQGEYSGSIRDTIEAGWALLEKLPREELLRIPDAVWAARRAAVHA